jgi:hypothetical protein
MGDFVNVKEYATNTLCPIVSRTKRSELEKHEYIFNGGLSKGEFPLASYRCKSLNYHFDAAMVEECLLRSGSSEK